MFSVGEDALTDQTIDKYKSVITENGGQIDRHEDWGPLKMAYDINNENKARYILISYNSGGIIPINVMDAMLAKYGTVTKIPVEHKTYNRLKGISEYKRTTQKEAIKEFFWLLQKSS